MSIDHDTSTWTSRPVFLNALSYAAISSRLSYCGPLFHEPGPTPSIFRKSQPQPANIDAMESMYFCAHGVEKSILYELSHPLVVRRSGYTSLCVLQPGAPATGKSPLSYTPLA